ncbi:hypothetical protein Bca52824_001649 [Brassica carinata]|uniref:Gnk2-homologous domain-containing protein n=1 Tax=Brassica carinata TaxID=52824 RepID=A0A8X7WIQ7_BRACI|nr:hypothetical protein Bca52824_001649 [Brassica carinata]
MHMRMQCTPDVSSKDCDFCLKPCCRGKQGCWVSRPTSLTPQASDRANTTGKDEKTSLTETIVADVIPTIVILAVLVVRFTVCRRTSVGQNQDRIFIIGMCIPGTEPEHCSDCIKRTSDGLLRACPNQTVGYAWPDVCMVRYSNISFSGSLIMEPSLQVLDPKDIDINLTVFDSVWEDLMLRTITAASSGSRRSFGHKYYAAQIAPLTSFQSLYSMMQCTPDVSSRDCEFCLKQTVSAYDICCLGYIGGAYVRPFCLIRWNLYPFAEAFDNIKLPERDGRNTTREGIFLHKICNKNLAMIVNDLTLCADRKTISTVAIVAIVVTIVVILVLLVVGLLVCRRRKAH